MKKGDFDKLFVFFALVLAVAFAYFVSASYDVVTGEALDTFYVDEDVWYVYNLSINNTETGALSNLSEVNITLPDSFTFVSESNATDAGTHTFNESGQVLSWFGADLVMNLTEHYFWFNATASTPGHYNLTIELLNSTDIITSNISVVVNDTTAPNITLISPLNGSSTTATSINFTFNISDASEIAECFLSYDGSVIHNTTSVNASTNPNSMYNSSFSQGDYEWSINCSDILGYQGESFTWALTIAAASSSTNEEETTSGGSSRPPVFRPSRDLLEQGYRRSFYKSWGASFYAGGESHKFEVDDISEGKVTVSVSSETQTAVLNVGESKMFEVTGDNYYDFYLEILSIAEASSSYSPRAEILMKTVHEIMPEQVEEGEEGVVADEGSAAEEEPGNSPAEEVGGSEGGWSTTALIIVVVVIVAIVAYFMVRRSSASTAR